MSRSRILISIAAAILGVGLLGACSAESLTERAFEVGLERAAEGEDIDIDLDLDFDGDGTGGINISTEEGDFAIGIDEEAGNIVFETEDGDGVINFDEQDGTVSITTDDESFSLTTNTEVPDNWPSVIGLPTTLVPGSANFSTTEIPGVAVVIGGVFSYAEGDPFGAELAERLKTAGWDGNSVTTSDGGTNGTFRKDGATIQIIADPTNAQVSYTQQGS